MTSIEIKEILDEWYTLNNENNPLDWKKALNKWKRLSKKKNINGEFERIFENTYTKEKVLVIEDEIKGIFSEGGYVFYVEDDTKEDFTWLVINNYNQFKEKGHNSNLLSSNFLLIPDYINKEFDNIFSSQKSKYQIQEQLLNLGFIEDISYSNYIRDNGGIFNTPSNWLPIMRRHFSDICYKDEEFTSKDLLDELLATIQRGLQHKEESVIYTEINNDLFLKLKWNRQDVLISINDLNKFGYYLEKNQTAEQFINKNWYKY